MPNVNVNQGEEALKRTLERKLKEIGSRRANWWKKVVGWSQIRVLRKEPGIPWYHEVMVHYKLGPDGKSQALCLAYAGESCPVCEKVAALIATGKASDADRADKISASRGYLMNILDLEDLDAGLCVYRAPETVITELIEYFCDPDYGDFTHPKRGFNVKIKRVGTGLTDTRYTVRLAKASSPAPKGYLKDLKDLTTLYPVRDAEEMTGLLGAAEGGEDDDYVCFGKQYAEDDAECDECVKGKACRRAMSGGAEASGKKGGKKASAKASAASRIAEEAGEDWEE